MEKLHITGGARLNGEVRVQGSKNAAQKILPATIAAPAEYLIQNVPHIQDSSHLLDTLRFLGCRVAEEAVGTFYIDTRSAQSREIPPHISSKSTGSFLFAGALLNRFGEAKIWHPGGDQIGKRRITWHLDAFRRLGAEVIEKDEHYEVKATRLSGNDIDFARYTVNGTVNAILAAMGANGTSTLRNVPFDPEIDNFIEFANLLGCHAFRTGDGHQIIVEGAQQHNSSVQVQVIPDRNDAATMIVAAVLGGGKVTLRHLRIQHLAPLISMLEHHGVRFTTLEDGDTQSLEVSCEQLLPPGLNVVGQSAPGFSTDWGPMIQVLMTQIPGESVFHETVFPERFSHLRFLAQMGANLEFFNPDVDDSTYNFSRDASDSNFHAVRIRGVTRLTARRVDAENVRAGAALTIAGLIAHGTTIVENAYQIDRGYESFEARLSQLGATVKRVGD